MTSATWEMVVGLEVHVHLRTTTKIFCGCSTNFGAPPNANTCPVCLGLPGALPVLNAHAVQLATEGALALDCEVQPTSVFARKNYFYPDLPKGYQISQFEQPLAVRGHVTINADGRGESRTIGITRVHMEEDAGKSIHDRYTGHTAIDLNRAGVPLIEIVTEPDMRSAREAGAFLRELKRILEYTGISDANMEEGSLRVDANISIRRPGVPTLGTKTEIKNMNSFTGVERALDVEFARQVALLEGGGRVEQQTLLWDAHREAVRPARSKEESHDYRYFPEPDLPVLQLSTVTIGAARERLPELPSARRARLQAEYGLPAYDSDVLTASRAVADYFEAAARAHGDAKVVGNWVMGDVLAILKTQGREISEFTVSPASLAALLDLVRAGTVSNTAAKRIFQIMVATGGDPRVIAEQEGLTQVRDDAQLIAWVDEVWKGNQDIAQRLIAGEQKLLGVLVGLVMKASGGRADPKRINALLRARAEAGDGSVPAA